MCYLKKIKKLVAVFFLITCCPKREKKNNLLQGKITTPWISNGPSLKTWETRVISPNIMEIENKDNSVTNNPNDSYDSWDLV